MAKKNQAAKPEAAARETFCTVKLRKQNVPVPKVVDGKVGELTVREYVESLQDGQLAEQVISIGGEFKTFSEFFATHIEWIRELRSRMPNSGHNCKLNVVELNGETKTHTWSEFCLKFFGVSADWVRKLSLAHEDAAMHPNIEEPKAKEGGEPKKESPLAEATRHLERAEDELDTVKVQASNLRHELGNILSKIEDFRKGKLSKEELFKSAEACRFRTVPPNVGDAMDCADGEFDSIGTDELKDQLKEVTEKGKALVKAKSTLDKAKSNLEKAESTLAKAEGAAAGKE